MGEYGDKFYVILEGKVSILVPNKAKKAAEEENTPYQDQTNTSKMKVNMHSSSKNQTSGEKNLQI